MEELEPEGVMEGGITEQFVYSIKVTALKSISPGLSVKEVSTNDGVVSVIYELTDPDNSTYDLKVLAQKDSRLNLNKVCSSNEYKQFLTKGAIIEYDYQDSRSNTVKLNAISLETCNELSK